MRKKKAYTGTPCILILKTTRSSIPVIGFPLGEKFTDSFFTEGFSRCLGQLFCFKPTNNIVEDKVRSCVEELILENPATLKEKKKKSNNQPPRSGGSVGITLGLQSGRPGFNSGEGFSGSMPGIWDKLSLLSLMKTIGYTYFERIANPVKESEVITDLTTDIFRLFQS